MGKIRQRRQGGSRYNPMQSSNGATEDEELCPSPHNSNMSKAGLNNILNKILSDAEEEIISGLNTLAGLAIESNAPQEIVEAGLINSIIPLLKNSSIRVRLTAAGALRNVCAGGSDEVVMAVIDADILSPLMDLLSKCDGNCTPPSSTTTTVTPSSETSTSDIDDATILWNHIYIHATHLLWSLCECSEAAIKFFNQEDLVHILIRHLDTSKWGYNIALASAECLLCVSDDNDHISSAILSIAPTLISSLSKHDSSASGLRYCVTTAGILMNISYCPTSDNNFQFILQVLSKVLEVDVTPMLLTSLQHAESADSMITNGSIQQTSKTSQEDVEHVISAQHLALELLSNICCSDDDEDYDDCESNTSVVDEEDMVSDADNSMEVSNNQITGNSISLPPEVEEGIICYGLVPKTLSKLQLPTDKVLEGLRERRLGPQIITKLGMLRVKSLLCLQNLVGCLDVVHLGGADLMFSTWVDLGKLAFNPENSDLSLIEATTSAMRALIDKLCASHCEHITKISLDDLTVIFKSGSSCTVPNVRANLARMIGILCCQLVKHFKEDELTCGATGEILKVSSEYLLKLAGQDEVLWVSAEALDVLIDLFSDDNTDKLARNVELVQRLKGIQPVFKTKMNQSKKALGDHKPLVHTVRDNLSAFIKYKVGRQTKKKTSGNKKR